MRKAIVLSVLFLGWTASVRADVLRLKNGDVINGTWERVLGKTLLFKGDTTGELTVDISKIQSLETTTLATALLPDRSTRDGKLQVSQGQWELVPTAPAGPPIEHLLAAYPQKDFAKLKKTIHAKPWQGWGGAASLGYSLISGDTQSRTFTGTANAERVQPNVPGLDVKWRSDFNLATIFSHAKSSSGAVVTSNTFSSGIRQDRLFDRNFIFALAQFDYIQPQGIKLRQTYGGGVGRDLIRHPKLNFSVLGGLTYVRTSLENTTGTPLPPGTPLLQNSMEALAGEKLAWRVTPWLTLAHDINFYPNLTQTGQYRFDTATSLAVPLTKRVSFTVSYVDFYLSNPLPGSHKNNATFSTGLGVRF